MAESLSYPRSYPTCLRVKKAQNPGSYATVQTKARAGILELRGDATFEMSAKNRDRRHRSWPQRAWGALGGRASSWVPAQPTFPNPSTALSTSLFRRHWGIRGDTNGAADPEAEVTVTLQSKLWQWISLHIFFWKQHTVNPYLSETTKIHAI